MLKKLILLLFVIAPVTIFAQEKTAFIDANEIFMKMPELKEVETKLAAKSETIQQRATAIQTEYQTKLEQFSTDTTAVTQSILLDRQGELETLEKRYQEFIQNSQAEFEREQQALIAPVRQKMMQAIKDVGDENNYTYILDAQHLLYVGTSAVNASKLVKTKLGIAD